MVLANEVQIRSFQPEDIPHLVSYWCDNSSEFWAQRGVDKSKLNSKAEMISSYEKLFKEGKGVRSICTILYQNIPVGVHVVNQLIENESGVFHAHIWSHELRGKGIAVYSYLKAVDFFMRTLALKKIIFKTPKINVAACRVKEKIGIPIIGDTIYDSPILMKPLEAHLYELDYEQLGTLKRKFSLL